jgi:hypothetical protein
MRHLPNKCIVDTNVPKTANLADNPANISDELVRCVQICVEAIDHVMNTGNLVMDSKDEIYNEYISNLCLSGRKGFGNAFMKWVHDNRWNFPDVDRVTITKNGGSYNEFPDHDGLAQFDNSDRKFIAVSNAHPDKPPILQATDSKWWGWKDALTEVGITVHFLCSDYVKTKYEEKIGP